MTSISYVKRFSIRPIGVVSKYDIGAYKTRSSIAEKTLLEALDPPVTAERKKLVGAVLVIAAQF